jgi:hypothetical protein
MHTLRISPIEIRWHGGLSIFSSDNFLRTVGDEYGWIGGMDEQGALRCFAPYAILRKPGFRIVRFRGETAAVGKPLGGGEERSFLNGVMRYFKSLNADLVVPASNNALFKAYPDGAVVAPYGTVVQDLTQTEDVLFSGFASDYRRNIRKAEKTGVQIETGREYLGDAYKLISETLSRSKMKFKSRETFERQVIEGLGQNVLLFVAK